MEKKISGIVVAAGTATRMEGIDKCFYQINGTELVLYSIKAVCESPRVAEVIVVTREEEVQRLIELCHRHQLHKVVKVVSGGSTRHQSVLAGVKETIGDYLLIHDGGRPLVPAEVIEDSIDVALLHGSAVAAVKVKDTIKVSSTGSWVESTPPRSSLYAVQTPQVFAKDLWMAGARLVDNPTDDGQLVEALGERVHLSKGSYKNIKVTTPEDLILVTALWKEEEKCV